MTLQTFLLDYIKDNPHSSFVELQRAGSCAGFNMQGDLEIMLGPHEHVVLWQRMSQEFSRAVSTMAESGQVALEPTGVLTYLVDGATLPLPVVVNPPKDGYMIDHWLPVVLSLKQAVR